jgi:hypothetical protein
MDRSKKQETMRLDKALVDAQRRMSMVEEKIAYWMGKRVDIEEHMVEIMEKKSLLQGEERS